MMGSNFQDIFARGTKAEQRRHGRMTEKLVWGGFHWSTSGKYDYQKEWWTIIYRIKRIWVHSKKKSKKGERKKKESWESSSLQKPANKCSCKGRIWWVPFCSPQLKLARIMDAKTTGLLRNNGHSLKYQPYIFLNRKEKRYLCNEKIWVSYYPSD